MMSDSDSRNTSGDELRIENEALRTRVLELEANTRRFEAFEAEWQESSRWLEDQVKDRTRELSMVVDQLKAEIADRSATQERALAGETRWRALLNAMPDMMFRLSGEGVFLDYHAARVDHLAVPPEAFLGKPVSDVFPEEFAEFTRANIKEALAKGSIHTYEYELPVMSGEARAYEARMVGIEPEEVVVIIRDITAARQARDALEESETRYRMMFENLASAVAVYEVLEDGARFVFKGFNRAAEKIEKISRLEVLGREITDVFPGVEEFGLLEVFREVWRTGEVQSHPISMYQDNRIAGWRENHVYRLPSGEVVALYDDVTEKKRLEADVQKAHKLESLGVLAGGIAHDFNNILTSILGNIGRARNRPGDPNIVARLDAAEQASLRARELTAQLLTFSKGGAPVTSAVPIAELTLNAVQFALQGTRITREVHLPDDLWWAEADSSQISRVLDNLLINAVQAMPDGGILLVSIANVIIDEGMGLALPSGRRYLRITVADSGDGIDEAALPRIFEPYFSAKEGGSGLGLAVAYSIVRAHNGLILADSVSGAGATFTVYLPAADGSSAVHIAPDDELIGGSGSILVMDDDEAIRELLSGLLEDLGYSVRTAERGEDMLSAYSEAAAAGSPFDAVIVDLVIHGGMGGSKAMARLLRKYPEAKGIVTSGYSSDPVLSEYRNYGFKAAISKPFRVEHLSRVLHRLLTDSDD